MRTTLCLKIPSTVCTIITGIFFLAVAPKVLSISGQQFFFFLWTPFPSSHEPRCKISDGLNKVLINFFFLSFKHMSVADPSVHIVCELVDLIFRCVCTVAAAHNVCFAFPCCGRPWYAGNWHFVILQQPTNLSTCPVKENKGHFF